MAPVFWVEKRGGGGGGGGGGGFDWAWGGAGMGWGRECGGMCSQREVKLMGEMI